MTSCIGSVRTIKKNTEASVVASKEIGLEVNADKTNYMVLSEDSNPGQNHSIKIDNKSFERVDQFRYVETTLTNQNSIQEDITGRSKSGNVVYHLLQNLCLPVSCPKCKDYDVQNCNFACCFVWV